MILVGSFVFVTAKLFEVGATSIVQYSFLGTFCSEMVVG